MSGRINQAVNQVRLTNVAVVRLKRVSQKFELACYKNKVISFRTGVETDLDEVLQTPTIFTNVSKGVLSSKAQIESAFPSDDERFSSEEKILKFILVKGTLQVSEGERKLFLENLRKDIATIVSKKTLNTKTNRPYSSETVLDLMRSVIKFAPKTNQSAKQQALKVIGLLLKEGVDIKRAPMRILLIEEIEYTRLTALLSKENIDINIDKQNSKVREFLISPKQLTDISKIFSREKMLFEIKEIDANTVSSIDVSELKITSSEKNEPNLNSEKSISIESKLTATTGENWKRDKFKCTTCKVGLGKDRKNLTNHFRTEIHSFNLKLKSKGKPVYSEGEYIRLGEEEKEHILAELSKVE
eukprot:augustus_masked-scaffold_58-processed-gene-0.1-mRNA-1 protein AED:0.03 eAED:0.07 QI:0/-1/0/1/-1/1/1/0/356